MPPQDANPTPSFGGFGLNGDGTVSAGPRLFTTASVRGILHNAFYAGLVRHGEQLLPGAHEPLVSEELFNLVQSTLKRNSDRSETLHPRPERDYLPQRIDTLCPLPHAYVGPDLHEWPSVLP